MKLIQQYSLKRSSVLHLKFKQHRRKLTAVKFFEKLHLQLLLKVLSEGGLVIKCTYITVSKNALKV